MKIKKRNGALENLSLNKILFRIRKICNDKKLGKLKGIDPDIIAQKVTNRIYDGISSSEIDDLTASITIALATENPYYGDIASRITISNMHKNTNDCFSEVMELLYKNIDVNGLSAPIVSESLINNVRLLKNEVNDYIDYDRDYNLNYFGYKTLEKSYLMKIYSRDNTFVVERPQHMFMRVSIGIHGNNIEKVKETYDLMSQGFFIHATPTLFNAGTPRPQLSSCFLLDGSTDSIDGIYKTLTDCAKISKWAGGIGFHIHDIRGNDGKIRGTNGVSSGIIPMLRVFNSTARYVNQSGRRMGSFASYLEPWHKDIMEFLDLKKNHGDEEQRARDLFYALWIPDLFMEKVKNDEDWFLMCPDESKGLSNVYSTEFNNLYNNYIEQGKFKEKIKARDLWKKIIDSHIETGTPYMLYKDSCNLKSNQKNLGTIKSSNLCVHPDTYILTDDGYYKIKELSNKNIMVWNGDTFSNTVVKKTGENQKLINIKFSNGVELKCTEYHKFHIQNFTDILAAKDLKRGMKLINHNFPIIDNSRNLLYPYTQGFFAGHDNCDNRYCYDDRNRIICGHPYGIDDKLFVPVNYSIKTKIQWLSGLLHTDICKIIDNYLVHITHSNIDFLTKITYLLNTLGCDSVINNNTLVISNYTLNKLKSFPFFSMKTFIKFLNTDGPHDITVVDIQDLNGTYDTYCFNEPIKNMGIFNGIIAGNCAEIVEYTSPDETAVCNLASIALPKFVTNSKQYDFDKLKDVVKVVVKNLDKVIDINYYPIPEAKNSNLKHRPIGLGVQGLADTYMKMRIPFDSDEAVALNKRIFESIQFAALESSMELAKEYGTYSSYENSPVSKGVFQHNMWGIDEQNLCEDWQGLRNNIMKFGIRNSLLTAVMPTASTSQILGNSECIEPIQSNIFLRRTLSGEFPVINSFLISDLFDLGLWNKHMRDQIVKNGGSIQDIPNIPSELKSLYKTVWELSQKYLINQSADRGAFIDQSQSLNLFMSQPTYKKLTSMHFYAWEKGLKTGQYYLRTKAAKEAIQFTIEPEKKDNSDVCDMCSG